MLLRVELIAIASVAPDNASKLEGVGENSLQKAHHRGRRKKHDMRMVDNVR